MKRFNEFVAWLFLLLILGALESIVLVYVIDNRNREYLHNDEITACRPPADQGEKLIATLRKSSDGGPLVLYCEYSAKLDWGQMK